MPRLYLILPVLLLLLSACNSADYSRGFVRDVQVEPRHPEAGQQVRIFVELHDPYFYLPDEPGPQVKLEVDGGEVAGQQHGESGLGWTTVRGSGVMVAPFAAMYWILPDEPGEYKLTVSFNGHSLTRRVVARPPTGG